MYLCQPQHDSSGQASLLPFLHKENKDKKKKRNENHTKIPGSVQCNINTFEMKTIPFYDCFVYSTAKDFHFLLQIKYVFKEIHSDF